jgi:nitrate reductase NapAB chaperone NapD
MNAAYVVLKFSHSDQLIPAVKQLESCPAVESWDAVEGQADLVLRVRCTPKGLPQEIQQLDGLKQTETYPIADGEKFSPAPKPLPIRAYLFIDTAPEQIEVVRQTLLSLPETLSCARMSEKCNLVALVKGETLGALKKTITGTIRALDGILRLRTDYAFNLKQL